jgi:hypothetical protein
MIIIAITGKYQDLTMRHSIYIMCFELMTGRMLARRARYEQLAVLNGSSLRLGRRARSDE